MKTLDNEVGYVDNSVDHSKETMYIDNNDKDCKEFR